MGLSKVEAVRRALRDYEVAVAACAHDAKPFLEAGGKDIVWIRCSACGTIREERLRCAALTLRAERCLGYVQDASTMCSVHAPQ
jgi:hypothetical protein